MAEDNTASDLELQAWLGLGRRYTQCAKDVSPFLEREGRLWLQDSANLKEPKEALRQESERIRWEIERAEDEVHTYFPSEGLSSPSGAAADHHERHRLALDRAAGLSAQLTIFYRHYDGMKKAMEKTYIRKVKQLEASRPRSDYLAQQDTPLLPDSKPGSPLPASSLPPASTGHNSIWTCSPEPGPSVGCPDGTARNAHSSNEEGDNINAVGTPTATEQVTRKRGRPEPFIHIFRLPPYKLRKLENCADPPLQTITFDEVYDGGYAHVKHWIVAYGADYYILRCDEHGMSFGRNPAQAAAKHLDSKHHGGIFTRSFWVAMRHLGIKVLNCDAEKQEMNNEACMRAWYRDDSPHTSEATDICWAQTQEQGRPARNTRSGRHRETAEITDPEAGGIYLMYWGASVAWSAVIVLPRNCLDDQSFADIGLPGCLADTSLSDDVPGCYHKCEGSRRIMGWEEGFEDGGDYVGDRKYPVWRIGEEEELGKSSLKWVSTKDLAALDDQIASNSGLISNYDALQRFLSARDWNMESAGRREEEDMADDSSSEAMQLEESESDASRLTEKPEETSQEPPEMTRAGDAATNPSATLDRPAEDTTGPPGRTLRPAEEVRAPFGDPEDEADGELGPSSTIEQPVCQGFKKVQESPPPSPPVVLNHSEPVPDVPRPHYQRTLGDLAESELWDLWKRHVRPGLFNTPKEQSHSTTPMVESLPIPFPDLGSETVPTQEDLSSETCVSRAAGHLTLVPEAFMASHDDDGYLDFVDHSAARDAE